MMYSGLPRPFGTLMKISLGASWLFAGATGVSAVVLSSVAVVRELGHWGTLVVGVALAFTASVAAVGVVAGRYRWEWVSAWMSAAALAPYLITMWALVVTGSWTGSTQAFIMTALAGFMISRAVACSAHAAKLREAHEVATHTLDVVTEGGGTNADGSDSGG